MKKILILAAAAAVLCSCANKNKYAVDGKVEGANSMVYLFDEKDNILDSTGCSASRAWPRNLRRPFCATHATTGRRSAPC